MKEHPSLFGKGIYTGSVRQGLGQIIEELEPSSVFIVADENTALFCVPLLGDITARGHTIVIPAGEQHKNLESCKEIWSYFIRHGADRHSLVLNVGGGMIGDLGGFAASCYQRGIRFGQVPTTVLGMADAALGGKTGIDYEGLKNYIGLIRVPTFIWIDEKFLETLPEIEKISGLAEIVKHAIIGSKDLWDILSRADSVENINWDEVLEKNFPVKLNIVESDPNEKGIRKVLNFGHTIGHALESYFLKASINITHGQCVALGMLAESKISNTMGLLNNTDFNSIVRLVDLLLDPVRISLPTFEKLNSWIIMDKKKSGSRIGYSLPDRIGSCGWDIAVEDKVVADSLQWLTQVLAMPKRLIVKE